MLKTMIQPSRSMVNFLLLLPLRLSNLHAAFADVEALAADCRFRDCAHDTEPGCAVRAALDAGDLDAGRFHSYLKLRKELASLARRQGETAIYEERKHNRALGRMYKEVQRHHRKR